MSDEVVKGEFLRFSTELGNFIYRYKCQRCGARFIETAT